MTSTPRGIDIPILEPLEKVEEPGDGIAHHVGVVAEAVHSRRGCDEETVAVPATRSQPAPPRQRPCAGVAPVQHRPADARGHRRKEGITRNHRRLRYQPETIGDRTTAPEHAGDQTLHTTETLGG